MNGFPLLLHVTLGIGGGGRNATVDTCRSASSAICAGRGSSATTGGTRIGWRWRYPLRPQWRCTDARLPQQTKRRSLRRDSLFQTAHVRLEDVRPITPGAARMAHGSQVLFAVL